MTEHLPASASELEAARQLFAGACSFVWGATSAHNLPPETLNEVALVGRSNAGKSSLVNALTGRRALARVSQTPGATRQINFFDLGSRLMLVDLPGYGFAKRSKAEAAQWQEMIFTYLRGRARLRRVVLLIDARRRVMDSDRQVMDLLDRAAVSYLLALTKADQLDKSAQAQALAAAGQESARHTAALQWVAVTSARSGNGIPELRAHLATLAA